MIKKYTVSIINHRPWVTWFKRLMSLTFVIVAPISIGILLQSSAMQWIGFVMSLIFILGISVGDKFKTTDEARNYLDRIDAGDV